MTAIANAGSSSGTRLPTFADVAAAHERIAGIAHRTPVLTSRFADARTGATLHFKCENLQRAGAFKFRGACNAIAALPEDAWEDGFRAAYDWLKARAERLLDHPVETMDTGEITALLRRIGRA